MASLPDPTGRSTNKYYASGATSAFRKSAADSRMAPGTTLAPGETPVVTPVSSPDERSTDKYYRDGGARSAGSLIKRGQVKPKPPAVRQRRKPPSRVKMIDSTIYVSDKEGIQAAKEMAITMAQQGSPRVIVAVSSELVVRVRAAFDMLVGQGVLDRAHRARIYVETTEAIAAMSGETVKEDRKVEEILGVPEAGDVGGEESALLEDPEQFLAAGGDTEEEAREAALAGNVAPAVQEAPETDFDEDMLTLSPPAGSSKIKGLTPTATVTDEAAGLSDDLLDEVPTAQPDLDKVPGQPKKKTRKQH